MPRETDRLDGRSCLVTGGTSGLGLATARELVRRGAAVTVTGRSANAELERRIAGHGGATSAGTGEHAHAVRTEQVDFMELRSVEALAERLAAREARFDVVVLNAGVVASAYRTSADGFETMLQTNYLANVLLVQRLLEHGCIRSGDGAARLIVVSSEAHRAAPDYSPERFTEIPAFSTAGAMRWYAYSKLLLTTYTWELQRRLEQDATADVSVFALCPGPVRSGIAREAPRILQPLIRLVLALFFPAAEQAAAPVVYLAASAEVARENGLYLHRMSEKQPDPRARDPELGRRLREATEEALRNSLWTGT